MERMATVRSKRSLAMSRSFVVRVFRDAFDRRRGVVRFVVCTTALSMAIVLLVLLPLAVVLSDVLHWRLDDPAVDPAAFIVIAVPLIENILLIGVVEFLLAFDLRTRTIVVCVGVLSAVLHGLVADLRAISGFVMFATMAYTYLLWNGSRFAKRYAITVAQHMLFNLPAAIAALLQHV